MSKTNKKNGSFCTFIMLRGEREGKKCNNPCRGDRCKYHNEKRQKYIAKQNKSKQRKGNKDTHKKILRKCKTINIKNLGAYLLKMGLRQKRIECIARDMIYHSRALNNVLNIESERLTEMKTKCNAQELYGPYKSKYPIDQLVRDKDGESSWVPIEYKPSEIEKFKKRLAEILKKKEPLITKLKQSRQYINILEKRQAEEAE